jgi:hypothetical protein
VDEIVAALAGDGATVVAGDWIVDRVRLVKSVAEQECVRRAGQIVDAAFASLAEFVRPGRTELEVAAHVNAVMAANGGEESAIRTMVSAGPDVWCRTHSPPSRRPVEVVVVDNRSTDPTREIVASYPVRLVEERGVQSSYAARNRGVVASTGEVLAFTDADCIPDRGWLRALVWPLVAPDVGGVAGAIEAYDTASTVERYQARHSIRAERAFAHPVLPFRRDRRHRWLERIRYLFRRALQSPAVCPRQRPHHPADRVLIFSGGLRPDDKIFHQEFGNRWVLAFGIVDEHDREAAADRRLRRRGISHHHTPWRGQRKDADTGNFSKCPTGSW